MKSNNKVEEIDVDETEQILGVAAAVDVGFPPLTGHVVYAARSAWG